MVNQFDPNSPNYLQGRPEMGVDYNGHTPMSEQYMDKDLIRNIVSQIDPAGVLNNLRRVLRGEIKDAKGKWIFSGRRLVNEECEYDVMTYLSGVLTNSTVMSTLSENDISNHMHTIIETIARMFVCNLERYGFVPPNPLSSKVGYMNRGTPDSSRMRQVANMVFQVCHIVLKRAVNGMESRKVFSSLSMTDAMQFDQQVNPKPQGWMGRMFGR